MALAACVSGAPTARAQGPASPPASGDRAPAMVLVGLEDIGGVADDWRRVRQTLGLDSTAGYLLRSGGGSLVRPRPGARFGVVLPELRSDWNSRLPGAGNTGQLWAGRGASASVRGGVALWAGPLSVVVVPELTHAQNLGYPIIPVAEDGRSVFARPFSAAGASADIPQRFGDAAITQVGLGQSSVTLRLRGAAVGFSGETLWWGPGVRNALVLSDNAEGVPHAFVGTARPLRTFVGDVEARAIVGGLTRSLYFDTTASDGFRALSGVVATLRLRGEPGLTLGVSRLVVRGVGSRHAIPGHAADALLRWGSTRTDDSTTAPRYDQLASLFGRWVFPTAGLEVWGEWARSELPRSLDELLTAPERSQAYTVGAAQSARAGRDGVIRVLVELTSLEQSRVSTELSPVGDFYTTRSTPYGFTQRGRVLGAAIGPGGSGQWLAVDLFRGPWQLGLFAERVRRENDALYREFLPNLFRHDVSVTGGVRVARRLPTVDLRLDAAYGDRLNYLFQNGAANVDHFRNVDLHNVSVSLRVTPRGRDERATRIPTR